MTVFPLSCIFSSAFLHNRAISIELQRNCVKEVSLFLFLYSRCLIWGVQQVLYEYICSTTSSTRMVAFPEPAVLVAMPVAR